MFKRTALSYGKSDDPVTPYQKAAQVWDERMGTSRVQARNWRLMAFGCLGLAGLMAGGLLWQAGRSSVTPYVVELDRLGAPHRVMPVDGTYEPSEAAIAWHLAHFIEDVRAKPTDPIVLRRNWLRAYETARGAAARTLGDYARAHDPFARVGEESVDVEVLSVVRASKHSFDVRWRERRYQQGRLDSTSLHRALAGVTIELPTDAVTLSKNPLGIYVSSLSWSRDFTPDPAEPQNTDPQK
ncbi:MULTISPECIES: conjugal transfer protein TrbF [Kordiimonas]|jgi:type IV secretion system protein VirB5|uniref:conjugal transfer protein TrbF n=1 Tax=Kordiimonas TaxID=288021 RepID=UPI00257DB992|nr:conjugal transfer protein TrbF [Kordiimonas sp. UBA4487]